jgi:8-oxo-dGTP diphosphatase
MEIWDILDKNGTTTGRTIKRSELLNEGEYHLVVHIWICDENGNFLIQRRPETVEWMPNIWATTGGSAVQGEDSLTAAVRETSEELGLQIHPNRFKHYMRQKGSNDFTDIWIVKGRSVEFSPVVLSDEVAAVKWAKAQDVIGMIYNKDFIEYDYAARFLTAER